MTRPAPRRRRALAASEGGQLFRASPESGPDFFASDGGQLFRDAATISSGSPDQISNSDSRAASDVGPRRPRRRARVLVGAGAAGLTLTSCLRSRGGAASGRCLCSSRRR